MPLYLVTDAETGEQVLVEAARNTGATRAMKEKIIADLELRFVAAELNEMEAFRLGQNGVKLFQPETSPVGNPAGTDVGEGVVVPAPSPIQNAPEESSHDLGAESADYPVTESALGDGEASASPDLSSGEMLRLLERESGHNLKLAGRLLDGVEHSEMPV